eukprot:sb/3475831/
MRFTCLLLIALFGLFAPIVDARRCRIRRLGCWRDKGQRAIPPMEGSHPALKGSYGSRKDPVRKCADVAASRGFKVFAVQNGGWCASGPHAHRTYKKYGRANNCRGGEGGGWANDVYALHCRG